MSSGLILLIAAVAGLILLEGFFSGAEIAIISANKTLLVNRYGPDSRVAKMLEHFHREPQWLIGTHLIGTNLCVVISSTLVTFYLRAKYGAIGEFYAVLLMSPLLLLLAEMVPKMAFQEYADRLAAKSLLGLRFFSFLFFPLVWVLAKIAQWATLVLGGEKEDAEPFLTRSEFKYLLTSYRRRKSLQAHEQRMIKRVFRFSETTVGEVMIPLVDLRGLEEHETVERALVVANRHPYAQYPVFHRRIDDIIGQVQMTDLLAEGDRTKKVSELAKPVNFVPETMPVDQLLTRMQREGFLAAMVVDEYGGCIGIITREDILEEIVGEIEDQREFDKPLYRQVGPNRWMLNARMEIDQINEIFGWDLPKEDYETLGGFLLNQFQRIPRAGELLRFQNLTFLIKRTSPRAILEVMVSKEEEESPKPEPTP